MRRMPQIPQMEKSLRMTSAFRGYNHNEIISDGEMFETVNLSDRLYPVLARRKRRGITAYEDKLSGIHGRDKLVLCGGTKVYYGGTEVSGISVSTATTMIPKKIVSMGAYVCIWPDKVFFNTVDPTDCGSMERLYTETGDNISLVMCRGDGTDYDMSTISVGTTPPANPANGKLWIDQSGDKDVLRQYYSPSKEWIEVASTYVKIGGTGVGTGLKEYDSVMISGMTPPDTETDQRIIDQVEALNGSYIVYGAGENYVIIAGLLSKTMIELKNDQVKVDRTVPDLDFVVESNNRLWGCKYGKQDGEVVNEIRACKLGDFRNWSTFMGISTDSYVASIGSDGEFTGAIAQRGYPVFFKEGYIHKVNGMTPSSYQISTTICRGVQRGSGRSVCVVNETIYYKSRQEIMAYDGNMPMSVSDQLGNQVFSDARAGAKGDRYYISMKNANNVYCLFTYNSKTGIWYKEDHTKALGFGAVGDELFFIDEASNSLVTVDGTMGTLEAEPEWSAEFGISGVENAPGNFGSMTRSDINGSHYLSRFDIRMYLEEEGRAQLEIMYDSDGEWRKQGGEIRGNRMRTIVLPVVPRRCDHLRFRIKGKGEFRIYSISRNLEVGSDG